MKKITLFLLACIMITSLSAQIVYTPVVSDGFETVNYPSEFNVLAQQAWNTLLAGKNSYPYTGTVWKDLYSNAAAADKTYSVNVVAENRTGGVGSQCLKFNLTAQTFGTYDAPLTLRWRSQNNIIVFNTGESNDKYELTFWARVDGDDKEVIMNKKNPNEFLKITSTWQKFNCDRYTTGTTSTALALDFYPTAANVDYSVYIDDLEVKQRVFVTPNVATDILNNGFTANWIALAGATGYNVAVQKVTNDGVNPVTYEAITGSPFAVSGGNTTSLIITGLESATTYRYKVNATDGNITTVDSEFISVITGTNTGLNDLRFTSISSLNGQICVDLLETSQLEVFNSTGQKILSKQCTAGFNKIALSAKGVVLVKIGNKVSKLIL